MAGGNRKPKKQQLTNHKERKERDLGKGMVS